MIPLSFRNLVITIAFGIASLSTSYALAGNGNMETEFISKKDEGGGQAMYLRLVNRKLDSPFTVTGVTIKDATDQSFVYVQKSPNTLVIDSADLMLATNESLAMSYQAAHRESYLGEPIGSTFLRFNLTGDAEWCSRHGLKRCRALPLLMEVDIVYSDGVTDHLLKNASLAAYN